MATVTDDQVRRVLAEALPRAVQNPAAEEVCEACGCRNQDCHLCDDCGGCDCCCKCDQ